jgi:hypothetical protein
MAEIKVQTCNMKGQCHIPNINLKPATWKTSATFLNNYQIPKKYITFRSILDIHKLVWGNKLSSCCGRNPFSETCWWM